MLKLDQKLEPTVQQGRAPGLMKSELALLRKSRLAVLV